MRARVALVLLTVLAPALLGLMMFGGRGLVWLGVPAICALPVLLILLGTPTRRPPLWGLLAVWVLLSVPWLAIGWLSSTRDLVRPEGEVAASVLGLMLFGVGLAPILLVGWLHARYFDDENLSPRALRRLGSGESP
jgi:hypothetical protein